VPETNTIISREYNIYLSSSFIIPISVYNQTVSARYTSP
jgi:hypothetical protein